MIFSLILSIFISEIANPAGLVPPKYWAPVAVSCIVHGVPPSLVASVGWAESRWESWAFRDNGDSQDRGLFQLNSLTFPGDVWEPEKNISLGVRFLKECFSRAKNWGDALLIYNSGRILGAPESAKKYRDRVLRGGV